MTKATSKGRFYIVAAPSGAGKTSLVKALIGQHPNLAVAVSHTTRPMRPGETDGVNYHFVTREQFMAMHGHGEFLESATVFGNLYGTSYGAVDTITAAGRDVILEIDWQGARQIRALRPEVSTIFILPPSLESLRSRLLGRDQDDASTIETRMAEAINEMSHFDEFDYLIINDEFGLALTQMYDIIEGRGQAFTLEVQQTAHSDLIRSLTGN
ncbi:MAG: guanylate kinase [Pseudomonadales bacterium]|nr:guanylate kinase [Pseudomonadales bacterium]